jgi:signal recognition particle receptor subunit beta
MATFNFSTMQMTVKVVYYGPGLCGKTTNLQFIYGHTTPKSRGEMVSLETKSDRTLFFDLLPLEVGTIAGFKTKIQLYTVPGQVFYNTTRKLVLKGVDGIVFVADSQRPMLPSNVESLANLEANLAELGIVMDTVPLVLQYNKRDLQDICTVEELDQALNSRGIPSVEAAAVSGAGVFETLRAISRLTLGALKKQLEEGPPRPTRAQPPAQRPAPTRLEPPAAARNLPKPVPPPTVAPMRRPTAVAAAPAAATQVQPAVVNKPSPPSIMPEKRIDGDGKLSRDVSMKLSPDELLRARRLSLSLRLEDAEQRVLHEVQKVELDLRNRADLHALRLQLNILLNADS